MQGVSIEKVAKYMGAKKGRTVKELKAKFNLANGYKLLGRVQKAGYTLLTIPMEPKGRGRPILRYCVMSRYS